MTAAKALAAAATMMMAARPLAAQASEIWPELDVYWQPALHQRSVLELSSSNDRDSPTRNVTIGAYQDYVFLPAGYLRAGYRYSFSTHDASYRESRLVGEATLRVASWGKLRLVERTRGEWRWVNGQPSYRVRERLHLQRWLPNQRGLAPAPYVTFEVYYDSRIGGISRVAGRVGLEARLLGPVWIDVYVARQNNQRELPAYVNALGATVKLLF
jgi:hypothetical protein